MSGKWLELLKEIAPGVTRAAVLRDPAVASGIGQVGAVQIVAPSLGVQVSPGRRAACRSLARASSSCRMYEGYVSAAPLRRCNRPAPRLASFRASPQSSLPKIPQIPGSATVHPAPASRNSPISAASSSCAIPNCPVASQPLASLKEDIAMRFSIEFVVGLLIGIAAGLTHYVWPQSAAKLFGAVQCLALEHCRIALRRPIGQDCPNR
jgi:hypothetical protein